MKLGLCFLMLADDHDPLGARWITTAKDAGFDYAEIPLGKIFSLPNREINQYLSAFRSADLPVEAFNCSLVPSIPLAGPDINTADIEYYINRSIELAVRFGVKTITSCAPIETSPDFDWENIGKPQYIDFLRNMADACRKYGIIYAIEPICRKEKGYVNTTAQAIALARTADRPNLKLIVDLFHFSQEHEDLSLLPSLCGDWLCHLHFADPAQRKVPAKANESIYRQQLKPLLDAGFQGRISIEAFSDNPEADLLPAVMALRHACR